MWKSIKLDKYLSCRSSLEAYPQIGNMILNNNLGLNLYVVLTIYYMIVILDQKTRYQGDQLITQLEE